MAIEKKKGKGETYKVDIDGSWSLEDLYTFPRTLEQVYFAIEALIPSEDEAVDERISRTFQIYPWQGGYSAVGFYNQLKYATPANRRPKIYSIQYASPGWIELGLIIPVVYVVAKTVNIMASTIGHCNSVYSQIYKDAQDRRLLGIEIQEKELIHDKNKLNFAMESSRQLAQIMQIEDVELIHSRTKNPLISMKILLSLYRRVRTLAEYRNRGKAKLRTDK